MSGTFAPASGTGGEPRRHARETQRERRRRDLHDDPKVFPGGERRSTPGAFRPAQHRGHRRRGASEPVRLYRRLRAPHARRIAQRLVHRIYRHAHRAYRQEYARGVRRLYQRLRHSARRRRQSDRADLLREPFSQLELDEAERPKIDPDFEEATEGEEVERKEKLKSKWAQLEAVVGAGKRIKLIAQDIVDHFESRAEAMLRQTQDEGKAMIVGMSRRICVELYREIVKLRPKWHDENDDRGVMKVVMTGSASDPPDWQMHIRNKARREELAKRFRNPADSFKIAIVRDMWLTGFDAPSLHTMYVDKPMRGHGLMQAIARVNRVFREKPGGLVVDYLGLAHELKQALATYTESGGTGETALDQAEAVAGLLEKYEICCGLFYGFDWSNWKSGKAQERLTILPAAQEHILAQKDGKERFVQVVRDLSRFFALAVPQDDALRIRDDVAFFQAVSAVLNKHAPGERKPQEELALIRQKMMD